MSMTIVYHGSLGDEGCQAACNLDLWNGRCDETQQEYNMPYGIPLEQHNMATASLLNPRIPAFCSLARVTY